MLASAKPYGIKASHRRRRKVASGRRRQRYYDPTIGRFLSVDPVTAYEKPMDNFNRYVYARNNPYSFTDPDGRESPCFSNNSGCGLRPETSQDRRDVVVSMMGFTAAMTGALFLPATATAGTATTGGVGLGVKSLVNAIKSLVGAGEKQAVQGEARSAANGLKLNKSLASEAQMGEKGTTIAGEGAKARFRDAGKIADQYGGKAADWSKKSSSSYTAKDGTKFETHWAENAKTGQRVEYKTKFPDPEK